MPLSAVKRLDPSWRIALTAGTRSRDARAAAFSGRMPNSYQEQYDRMKRGSSRFAALDQGRSHDVASDNYVDDIYASFMNCYHLKDWILAVILGLRVSRCVARAGEPRPASGHRHGALEGHLEELQQVQRVSSERVTPGAPQISR